MHLQLATVLQRICHIVLIHVCRINNAGSNAYKYKPLSESTDADLIRIVETNVLGVMLGCKEVRLNSSFPCLGPSSVCAGLS